MRRPSWPESWRRAYAWCLLVVGLAVLADLWQALGRPGGRCPACLDRIGWAPHICVLLRPRGPEGPTGDSEADLAAFRGEA